MIELRGFTRRTFVGRVAAAAFAAVPGALALARPQPARALGICAEHIHCEFNGNRCDRGTRQLFMDCWDMTGVYCYRYTMDVGPC